LSGLAFCGQCGKALTGQDAKSGKFSYYVCGSLNKRGAGACTTPYLNSNKFENLVVTKIKEHILTTENLTQLVELVNEEMDSSSSEYRKEMDTIARELGGVDQRLDNLYNLIETGKIELDLLKPRLQQLKQQHDRLLARKAELEILLSQRKIELVGPELTRQYVEDLRQFIDSTELTERRSFVKSFVKEIKVTGNEGRIRYTFPLPPDNHEEEKLGVLPIVRYSGRYRT
jgi:site-specific DNA recombinase